MNTNLHLYEQLQLLSMRDEDGKPHDYNQMQRLGYALAGAILMDLFTDSFVTLDEKKNCIVQHQNPSSATDATLSAALIRIAKAKKPKDAKYWVQMLYAYSTSSGRLLESLLAKGIIRKELRTKWKFFTVKRFPVADISAKQAIVESLEKLIVGDDSPQYQTMVLLSLVQSARLLPYIFPERWKNNPKDLEANVQEVLQKASYGNFTDEALEDAQRRQEMLEAMEVSLDMLSLAMNVIADAVDSSADAGGGDGGDGGGD